MCTYTRDECDSVAIGALIQWNYMNNDSQRLVDSGMKVVVTENKISDDHDFMRFGLS